MEAFKNPVKAYSNSIIDTEYYDIKEAEITLKKARTRNLSADNFESGDFATIKSVSGGYEIRKKGNSIFGVRAVPYQVVIAPKQTITISLSVKTNDDIKFGAKGGILVWEYRGIQVFKEFTNLKSNFEREALTFTNSTSRRAHIIIYIVPPMDNRYTLIFKGLQIELGKNATGNRFHYLYKEKTIKVSAYDDRLYFNAKELLKTYFDNKTEIHKLSTETGVFLDHNAYKTLVMSWKQFSHEFEPVTYLSFFHAIRGARQIKDTYETNDVEVLHNQYKGVVYISVWEGYPLCISVYGQDLSLLKTEFLATNLATSNKTINLSGTEALGVWRVSIYDSVDYLNGFIELEKNERTRINLNNNIIIIDKKKECGLYLKWLNDLGGWDYHMFTNFENSTSSDDLEIINNDFENVETSENNFVTIGKEVKENIKVFASVEKHEFAKLTGILHALKVFVYIEKTKWVQVNVKGKVKTNSRQAKANLSFTLQMPNIYTITR